MYCVCASAPTLHQPTNQSAASQPASYLLPRGAAVSSFINTAAWSNATLQHCAQLILSYQLPAVGGTTSGRTRHT
jgi:hypothetical protein